MIIPAAKALFASTLNNSTSRRVVFNVVRSPFAVKFPPTTKLPLISPFPFKSKVCAVKIPAEILIPSTVSVVAPPTTTLLKGPSNWVAVIIPLEFIL